MEPLEPRQLMAVVGRIVEDSVPLGGLNNGSMPAEIGSEFVEVNGVGYFVADDGVNGSELWRVAAGGLAEMVEDAIPGGGLAAGRRGSSPRYLTNVNGTLFFAADNGVDGNELWRLSGSGPAEIVEDGIADGGLYPGSGDAFPSDLTNVNGTLYFVARDPENGRELWRMNGSTATLVEDAIPEGGIRPSNQGSIPKYLTVVDGQLFFQANDGSNGIELWRVPNGGTASMVEDSLPGGGIAVGSYDSLPKGLTNVGGTLYFSAFDFDNGYELWRVSGSGNAQLVAREGGLGGGLATDASSSYPDLLTNVGGTLYFKADDALAGTELWRINSNGNGEMIEDSVPGGGINPLLASSDPAQLTNVGGTLYFQATTASEGIELWRVPLSGIAEIVTPVGMSGIAPGSASATPQYLTEVQGTLYFAANDGVNGNELWRVVSGAVEMVEDGIPGGGIAAGIASSSPNQLFNANGALYFVAGNPTTGRELWHVASGGIATLIEDSVIDGGIRSGPDSSFPHPLSLLNGSLYFVANNGTQGAELWRLNASNIASLVSADASGNGINRNSASSVPHELTVLDGTLYFSAFDPINGMELWRVTNSGNAELIEDSIPGEGLRPGAEGSYPREFTQIGSTLYFTTDTENGTGLWQLPAGGTASLIVETLRSGGIQMPGSLRPSSGLTNVNGSLYFVAADTVHGNELWRLNSMGAAEVVMGSSGGIASGTSSSDPEQLTVVNGTLYFVASNATLGTELWRIDGTGNAVVIEDGTPGGGIYPGSDSAFPRELTNHLGTLYFQANDGTNGRELWRLNATQGAVLVEDAVAGNGLNATAGSYPALLSSIQGTLYFQADDGVNGLELWRLSSTTGLASMIEDNVAGGGLNPGLAGSNPRQLVDVGGTLYFSAFNALNGTELWRLNGTTESAIAELVEDAIPGGGIRPGADGSGPTSLTDIAGTLYFSANDGVNGTELWRVLGGTAVMAEDAIPGGGLNDGIESSFPHQLTNVAGTLYFVATRDGHGEELWQIEGGGLASEVSGPKGGEQILPGPDDASPRHLVNLQGTLYFAADAGREYGVELLRLLPNTSPSLTRNLATVQGSVGSALQNTGTWTDSDGDAVQLTASLGTVVRNGNGTWSWSLTPSAAISNQIVTITATDPHGGQSSVDFTVNAVVTAQVLDRKIFYNRALNLNFGSASANPINAIDPRIEALRPGQPAETKHYSNYVRGLNGILVDVANLGSSTSAADFLFATSFDGNTFTPLTEPALVSLVPGGGVSGSTRIRIEFNDGAVKNTWLRVTLLANANTLLASPDVFYFGNAIADMYQGNIGSPPIVRTNATDTAIVRQNQSIAINSALIGNFHDINKDGRVNATDTALVRQNQASNLLRFFTAPLNLQLSPTAGDLSSALSLSLPVEFTSTRSLVSDEPTAAGASGEQPTLSSPPPTSTIAEQTSGNARACVAVDPLPNPAPSGSQTTPLGAPAVRRELLEPSLIDAFFADYT